MKFIHWIVAICLLTASFDIFLNFDIGGSVRLAQLLLIFVIFAAAGEAVASGRILWPRGGTALVVWMLFQAAFLFSTNSFLITSEFFLLLLLLVASFFAFVQLYGRSLWIERMMRVYLLSYVALGVWGLIQFSLPLVGGPGIFVTQWIIHGRLARINGFCYEPSYYVTYMFLGWITLIDLSFSRAAIVQSRFWRVGTVLVTLSILVSTSRTGWAFLLLETAVRVLPVVVRRIRAVLARFRSGRFTVFMPRGATVAIAGSLLALVTLVAVFLPRFIDPTLFLAGSGIGNTAAHSVDDRNRGAVRTWEAFEDSPLMGRSMGGVNVYLAQRAGAHVSTITEARFYNGFPVILEVLLGSGLIGFIPFLYFTWSLTGGAYRIARERLSDERAKWLKALARALIYEWLIFFFDQNLFRLYFWFHMSVLAAVAYHLEFGPAWVYSGKGWGFRFLPDVWRSRRTAAPEFAPVADRLRT